MHERCSRRDCDAMKDIRNDGEIMMSWNACEWSMWVHLAMTICLFITHGWLSVHKTYRSFFFYFQLQNYAVHSTAFTAVGWKKKWLEDYLQFCHWKRKEWVIWFPFSCNILIGVFLYSARIYVFFHFLHICARWMCVKHILKYWQAKKIAITRTHAVITFESH